MKYFLRKPNMNEAEFIMGIYDDAKKFMSECGLSQWSKQYPNIGIIKKDIEKENLYLLINDYDDIVAVACVIFEDEPTYSKIYNGNWSSNEDYATIHRMAVAKKYRGKNLIQYMFEEIKKMVFNNNYMWIRVDTHERNIPMKKSIEKAKFKKKGTIFVSDASERIAYDINLLEYYEKI